ncbi:helix-turn-helix domain-containing protein [Enhygromyxa salina]|nr:helix-turn-helix transcriptional regulator [Enhygromyxa salina]
MSTEARKRLGQKLRMGRETAGLSQEQVAAELRLPRPAISQIENGNRRVEALELGRMAKLYGRPLNYFADEGQDYDNLSVLHRAVKDLSDNDRKQVLQFAEFLRKKGQGAE